MLDSSGNMRYNGYANGEQHLHTLRICNSKGNGRFYRPFSFFAFFKKLFKKVLTNGKHGVIMLSNPRDISVLRRWMAHFGKDILITAWLFRLLIGGVSRVRAGVKWSLRNSRYIKLLQKSRVATYRWRPFIDHRKGRTSLNKNERRENKWHLKSFYSFWRHLPQL